MFDEPFGTKQDPKNESLTSLASLTSLTSLPSLGLKVRNVSHLTNARTRTRMPRSGRVTSYLIFCVVAAICVIQIIGGDSRLMNKLKAI